jgi:hypothetical protein
MKVFAYIVLFCALFTFCTYWYQASYSSTPKFTTITYGEVAPGTIYTTLINMNAYESFLPKTDSYIIELDSVGTLQYAKKISDEFTYVDYRAYDDGLYTIGRFPSEPKIKNGAWEIRDTNRSVVKELVVSDNPITDDHGVYRMKNGNYVLPSYKQHQGENGQVVVSFLIEEVTPAGEVVFVWDSINHIELNEKDSVEVREYWLENNINDYFHGNSIAEANDGNFLLSGRHINQIVKIDHQTGEVLWQLGGKSSDFTFIDDPLGGFSHQHSVSQLPNGNILLYDNGNQHSPPQTRVVEYQLDEEKGTATLVWSYQIPGRFTFATGSVQRLPDGHTLIGWGMEYEMTSSTTRITELDENGEVVMEIFFPDDAGFYSAYKL